MQTTTLADFQRYDLVLHRRTGNHYRLDRFLKVRVNGKWEAGVGYYSVDDPEEYYVRTLEEFIGGFVRVVV